MTNPNADEYANARLNIYFPGNPASLDGQCVSLVKWFLQEMTAVPNPQAARGHAKDYGDTLVDQGHATVVTAANRRRGDLVVWKSDGGGYGHIGVLLSGDRVFEQNVGLAGIPSKMVGSNRVYASRIHPLVQSWRKGSPVYYLVKTYNEGAKTVDANDLNHIYQYGPLGRARGAKEGEDVYLGKTAAFVIADHAKSGEGMRRAAAIAEAFKRPQTVVKEVVVTKEVPVEVEKIVEVEVEKVVEKEVIKEVVKGDDDRTFGDLFMAAIQKLFKLK
jgi:hypothetical protein